MFGLQVTVQRRGQPRQELKTGTLRQDLKTEEETERNTAYLLGLHGLFSLFYCTTQDPPALMQLRGSTCPQWAWALSLQPLITRAPQRARTHTTSQAFLQTTLWGAIPQRKISFSQVTLIYIKQTTTNQQGEEGKLSLFAVCSFSRGELLA